MAATGAALAVGYTVLASGADAITKVIAGAYAAPQLYAMSGLLVALMSLAADRHPAQRRGFRTTCPRAMAMRSAATVIAAIAFFQAFRLLSFAEVFPFVALIPIIAALMSGPVLGEPVRPVAWAALGVGVLGVFCLFPAGLGSIGAGHLWALLASVTGTFSIVLARYIGRRESNGLALVLYPNLALCVAMGLVLPFVWRPMPLADLGWVVGYAVLLFSARWVLVLSLRRLPAYAVTPLLNLQFVWMVALGALAFGEAPEMRVMLGATAVIVSGVALVLGEAFGTGTLRENPARA